MAVPEKVRPEDAQKYYDTADSIGLKPGWMQGEGQPLPEMEPFLWRWNEVEPLVLKSGELVTPDRDVERRTPAAGHSGPGPGAPPTPSPPRCNCSCPESAPRRTGTRPRPSGGCCRDRELTPPSRATSATWSPVTWFSRLPGPGTTTTMRAMSP